MIIGICAATAITVFGMAILVILVLRRRGCAKIGDVYHFVYPESPEFDCNLTVVRVCGSKPDDLVFFDDHTHSKQKHLYRVPRISLPKATARTS